MQLAHRWSDRNLSRIELTAALLILSLLVGGFVERMIRIFASAERSFVETTVINLNSALQVRATMAAMNGDWAGLRAMIEDSPMQTPLPGQSVPGQGEGQQEGNAAIKETLPGSGNYLGVLSAVGPDEVPERSWYFDAASRELVYRVSNDEFFEGEPVLRYQINVDFTDNNQNGTYEPDLDEFTRLHLDRVGGGQWRL